MCILSDHLIYDVDEDATFAWRKEGDTWDEDEDAEGDDAEEAEGEEKGDVNEVRELVFFID